MTITTEIRGDSRINFDGAVEFCPHAKMLCGAWIA